MRNGEVVVVGAGFSGLATAALLAKDGLDVTVIEKNEQPGGRASVWKEGGFTFDMGPSWYLMPDVFERFFAEFGKKPEDLMELVRLDPSYRVFYGPDDSLDISSDLEKNLALFDKMEENGAEKMKKYLDSAQHQYDVAMNQFIYKDYKHLTDFFNRKLVMEGAKLHVFDKLDHYAQRFFENPKIRKILEYNIVFLGGTPYNTPALYALMSHVDFNLGVWYPIGGLGKLVEVMYDIGKSQGVNFIFNEEVKKIEIEGKTAKKVITDTNSYEADTIVVNADYAYAETQLLDKKHQSYPKKYWEGKSIAPSALLFFLGLDKKMDNLIHHNLYFHPQWEKHFDTIFKHPAWPDEPSYYVSCTSKTDPTSAPQGKENMFILVTVAPGLEDNEEIRERFYSKTLEHLEGLAGENIRDSVVVKRSFAHKDFSERYNAYQGTALGFAHTLRQTAIFRPRHKSKKVKNLYYTGHYTHPGIGVPMVIISSQILSKEIGVKHAK
jgi:phytoene desaturase